MTDKETHPIEKPSLLHMITDPVEQFKRIRHQPFFWMPLLIVTIVTIFGLWLTTFGVELPLDQLSEEEIAQGKVATYIGIVLAGILTTATSVLMSTLIYFIFVKAVRAEATFRQILTMNTYIMFITAISVVVNGLLIALFGSESNSDPLYTSLASYLTADGALGIIFNHIEIFAIWTIILTAIGFQYVANIPKKLSWIIAGLFFVTGIITGIMQLNG